MHHHFTFSTTPHTAYTQYLNSRNIFNWFGCLIKLALQCIHSMWTANQEPHSDQRATTTFIDAGCCWSVYEVSWPLLRLPCLVGGLHSPHSVYLICIFVVIVLCLYWFKRYLWKSFICIVALRNKAKYLMKRENKIVKKCLQFTEMISFTFLAKSIWILWFPMYKNDFFFFLAKTSEFYDFLLHLEIKNLEKL